MKKKEMKPAIEIEIETEEKDGPDEHELEMCAQDLMKAHKIKADKTLMGHVAKHMKKKKMHMDEMMSEMPAEDGPVKSLEDLKKKKSKAFKAPQL